MLPSRGPVRSWSRRHLLAAALAAATLAAAALAAATLAAAALALAAAARVSTWVRSLRSNMAEPWPPRRCR